MVILDVEVHTLPANEFWRMQARPQRTKTSRHIVNPNTEARS